MSRKNPNRVIPQTVDYVKNQNHHRIRNQPKSVSLIFPFVQGQTSIFPSTDHRVRCFCFPFSINWMQFIQLVNSRPGILSHSDKFQQKVLGQSRSKHPQTIFKYCILQFRFEYNACCLRLNCKQSCYGPRHNM